MGNKSLDVQNSDLILILKKILHEKSIQQATTDTHIRPVLPLIIPSRTIASASVSANTNFYTVPTGKTLYITNANLSYAKDANSTMADIFLCMQFVGNTTYYNFLELRGITLTASTQNATQIFRNPLECPQGTLIAVRMNADGAVINASATIEGYELDTK